MHDEAVSIASGGGRDAWLMGRVALGDMHALGELARRHRERVRRLAYRILGRWDAAEDVAQETMLRLHRSADRYKPEARFTTWLYRVVVNLCHDAQRRTMRQPLALADYDRPTQDGPAHAMERQELAQRVAAAVAKLPHRQRTALVLHRYENLSHSQIAEATGWSAAAVESLLVRAYARLRKELADLRES